MTAAACRTYIKVLLTVLMVLLTTSSAFSQAQDKSKSKTGLSNPDSVNDLITTSFSSHLEQVQLAQPDIDKIQVQEEFDWPSGTDNKTELEVLVDKWMPDESLNACRLFDAKQIYIFHITLWEKGSDPPFRLKSSGWYAYRFVPKESELKFSGFSGTGDQLIYGKTKALIIGISEFSQDTTDEMLKGFTEQYRTTVIQGTPENAQNLGRILEALSGTGEAVSPTAESVRRPIPVLVSIGCQAGSKLPFTLTVNVTDTFKPQPAKTAATDDLKDTKPKDTKTNVQQRVEAPTNAGVEEPGNKNSSGTPSPGTMTCSTDSNQMSCATAHSFVAQDREWWDVSIGITVPGTRETQYSFSTSGTVQTSVTRHTDLYGMFDVFPGAHRWPKESPIPHFVLGLPVTSQSLHRPYFGVAENLTGWTHLEKTLALPVGMNVFVGEVYMKTNDLVGSPTTQAEFNADLKPKRVWKTLFGIEVPISSIASKIGKKGSSSAKAGSGS